MSTVLPLVAHPSSGSGCIKTAVAEQVGSQAPLQKRRRLSAKTQVPQYVWPDNERVELSTDARMKLLQLLQEEVTLELDLSCAQTSESVGTKSLRCRLCPLRFVPGGVAGLQRHIKAHHDSRNNFVCSGTKQMRTIKAIYDHDCCLGSEPCHLLQRSATLMRENVTVDTYTSVDQIDRFLRLVLHDQGPSFVCESDLGTTWMVRRCGNVLYTREFANAFLRQLLWQRGALQTAMDNLHLHFNMCGTPLGNLMPRGSHSLAKVAEDILNNPVVKRVEEPTLSQLTANGEFESLAMDGTAKLCLKLLGQVHPRVAKRSSDAGAIPDDEHKRKLVTVNGATGATLGIFPVKEEDAGSILDAVRNAWPQHVLDRTRFLSVDAPSRLLLVTLKQAFSNLHIVSLDPVHLAIGYERGFVGRRSPGSKELRRIINRFNVTNSGLDPMHWGHAYAGENEPELNNGEAAMLECVKKGSMEDEAAQKWLDELPVDQPFYNRLDFITSIATLVRKHRKEMGRHASPKTTLRNLLVHACEPGRCEWYFNNHQHRHLLDPHAAASPPSGTTSNEAFHAELKTSSSNVIRIHQQTLYIRLHFSVWQNY